MEYYFILVKEWAILAWKYTSTKELATFIEEQTTSVWESTNSIDEEFNLTKEQNISLIKILNITNALLVQWTKFEY